MSKRAEEYLHQFDQYGIPVTSFTWDDMVECYDDSHKQAEKDLAPLIEAATAVYEAWNGGTMDDVRREIVELGKRIMEAKK